MFIPKITSAEDFGYYTSIPFCQLDLDMDDFTKPDKLMMQFSLAALQSEG